MSSADRGNAYTTQNNTDSYNFTCNKRTVELAHYYTLLTYQSINLDF